jgi:hypothetical protein
MIDSWQNFKYLKFNVKATTFDYVLNCVKANLCYILCIHKYYVFYIALQTISK